jgi:hypothetical protein
MPHLVGAQPSLARRARRIRYGRTRRALASTEVVENSERRPMRRCGVGGGGHRPLSALASIAVTRDEGSQRPDQIHDFLELRKDELQESSCCPAWSPSRRRP